MCSTKPTKQKPLFHTMGLSTLADKGTSPRSLANKLQARQT